MTAIAAAGPSQHQWFNLEVQPTWGFVRLDGVDGRAVSALGKPGPLQSAPRYRFTSDRDLVADMPMASWIARLVSAKWRETVEPFLGVRDNVEWLPQDVETASGDTLDYFLLRFVEPQDTLHSSSTIGPSGVPMLWVLDRAKLEGRALCGVPKGSATCVRGDVKEAIVEAGITGMKVRPARIR